MEVDKTKKLSKEKGQQVWDAMMNLSFGVGGSGFQLGLLLFLWVSSASLDRLRCKAAQAQPPACSRMEARRRSSKGA